MSVASCIILVNSIDLDVKSLVVLIIYSVVVVLLTGGHLGVVNKHA